LDKDNISNLISNYDENSYVDFDEIEAKLVNIRKDLVYDIVERNEYVGQLALFIELEKNILFEYEDSCQ
jgi:hypothetical protein